MASALQQIVTEIQQNNYVSLIVLTAVGYDYVLMFSDEVEYIWNKPWTWVSSMFFLTRYFGICWAIISSIFGSSFLPGPINVYVSAYQAFQINDKVETIFFLGQFALVVLSRWAQCIFISAADLVMILRVWALYHRSKLILFILLSPYAIEVLALLGTAFAFSISYNSYGTVIPILNYSLCGQQTISNVYAEIMDFAQLTLGALMCLFISYRFIGESIETYRTRRRFQLSNYMDLLLRESIFYFLVVLSYALTNSLLVFNVLTAVWWAMVEFVPIITLVPRFTISLRKLYAHDLRRGRDSTLDTAFGFGYDEVGGSMIMFVDDQPGQNVEQVAMDERNLGTGADAT